MDTRRRFRRLSTALALVALVAAADVAAGKEIKGAAILDHPCGKLAVKHMGLVHAGKMAEAVALGTASMQEQWQAMQAAERTMMSGMMKELSQTAEQFTAAITSGGVLVVDGSSAKLTVTKETRDASGSGTETMSQSYLIDAKGCWISR